MVPTLKIRSRNRLSNDIPIRSRLLHLDVRKLTHERLGLTVSFKFFCIIKGVITAP